MVHTGLRNGQAGNEINSIKQNKLKRMKVEKWGQLGIKDQIQYITAIVLIFSGVVIAFLSFFLNSFNIATGVLIYIAQAFVAGGSIFGVSIYFKTKLGEFKSDAVEEIQKAVGNLISDRMQDSKVE